VPEPRIVNFIKVLNRKKDEEGKKTLPAARIGRAIGLRRKSKRRFGKIRSLNDPFVKLSSNFTGRINFSLTSW
jgi:hypothetical protein